MLVCVSFVFLKCFCQQLPPLGAGVSETLLECDTLRYEITDRLLCPYMEILCPLRNRRALSFEFRTVLSSVLLLQCFKSDARATVERTRFEIRCRFL